MWHHNQTLFLDNLLWQLLFKNVWNWVKTWYVIEFTKVQHQMGHVRSIQMMPCTMFCHFWRKSCANCGKMLLLQTFALKLNRCYFSKWFSQHKHKLLKCILRIQKVQSFEICIVFLCTHSFKCCLKKRQALKKYFYTSHNKVFHEFNCFKWKENY